MCRRWCGRRGTDSSQNWDYHLPLCSSGGIDDYGCLLGFRLHDQAMSDALRGMFCLRSKSIIDLKRRTLQLIIDELATFLGGLLWHCDYVPEPKVSHESLQLDSSFDVH